MARWVAVRPWASQRFITGFSLGWLRCTSRWQFQGRRWEWVDPLKDIEADIAAINAGLKSPQSVAAKLGLDYEDLPIEIKAAETMRERLGVVLAITPNPQQLAAAAGAAASATNTTT